MRVESFTSTNGLTRYILVDSSGVPVDVVLRFLRFKDNCGRARNTLRAYCFHLKSYFEYLEFIGMSFPQIGMDELAGFIRWLQNNHRQKKIMSFPAATVSTCSAQTINVANCKCKLNTCTVELSESERRSGWKPLAFILGDAAAAFGCVNRVEELVKQFLRSTVAQFLARPSV